MTNFYNRELSWLSFNYRVLQEAKDPLVPLYERIKFLAIYSSNLDEFFRVRVASLRSLLNLKNKTKKKLDFSPEELLKQIHKTVNRQQEEFGKIYREQIIPQLEQNKIFILNNDELLPQHKDYLVDFFNRELKPYLQPILLDKRIETFLQNKVIYIAVRLKNLENSTITKKKKRFKYGLIEVPSRTGRFIILPEVEENKSIIFLDDVIKIFLPELFPGYEIESSYAVKLTRDAELYIDDEFTGDLLDKIKKSLSKRNTGVPSRFLYDAQMPKDFLKYLRNCIRLNKDDLIPGGRYHNYNDFFSFPEFNRRKPDRHPELVSGSYSPTEIPNQVQNDTSVPHPLLKYEPMFPNKSKILEKYNSIFKAVSEQDILLHFPYQNYEYVIKFIDEAANDPDVKSIYITLYRVASNSHIIKALSKASANGKKVIAFVEVKARFDEESNFSCAEELQRAGVKVLYSFPGLKVHSKVCLISRIENEQKAYYGYFSTGNFNEKTAGIYSDYGLFTKDERLTEEGRRVFDILTKKKEKENVTLPAGKFEHLLTAPFNLRSSLQKLIDKEIENAKAGKKAYIILKSNSLEDRKMVKHLYKASQAGVKLTLIIRGICCLIPNKNIKVISIVDRFLEHSRVFIFCNNGNDHRLSAGSRFKREKIYVSSADWMTRNLDRRIEVCFPVYSDEIKKQIREMINIQLKDNVKARIINKFQNNKYKKTNSNKKIRAQYEIYDHLKRINSLNEVKSI